MQQLNHKIYSLTFVYNNNLFQMKTIQITILLVLALNFGVQAQKSEQVTTDDAVELINSVLGPTVKFEYKKKINLTFYKNNEVFRTDEVHPFLLDAEQTSYNAEEGLLNIMCKSNDQSCVFRKFPTKKLVNNYNGINLDVSAEQAEKLKEAINFIILTAQDKEYVRFDPF